MGLAAAFGAPTFLAKGGETRFSPPPPPPARIIAVGHRGTVKHAPENTIAAHEAAIARGARLIEFDVRMTRDGHFVLMHDATVNRTTDGRGRVSELTLAEIRRLDAGGWFGPEFRGEKVPTLREALRNIYGRAAVDIDFKGGPAGSGRILADILDEEGYADGPLVTVFARAADYDKLRDVAPRYVLRPHYVSAERTAEVAKEDGVEIMGLRRRSFSFEKARIVRAHGMELFANVMGFSDGEKAFADSVAAGARYIQTDKLDELVAYLSERGLYDDCVPARGGGCWKGSSTRLMARADPVEGQRAAMTLAR
jgi:glycerophosphoryl diester phosphodiesterase